MRRMRLAVLRLGGIALATCLLAGAGAGSAAADRSFAPRFEADADGGLTQAANTLESCPSTAAGCAAARDGTGPLLDDNDFAMQYVDDDSDPATFDSSSARLVLPSGARVLFAGLYVGGRTDPGTRGLRARDASPDALRTVLLRAPDDRSYVRLGPTDVTLDQSTTVRGAYQAVHDVTDLVRRAGAGTYTVADVQAATGVDRYAGWALEVAYAAPDDPPRNLSVFDGLQSVTRGQPSPTISPAGFTTRLEGAVRTQVGVVAYEGDLGSAGDSMSLDGHVLGDATDPATNFFDSGISIDGVPSTDKSPDYRDQLGFDAKIVDADGALPNGATAATIALTTTLEQYLPGMVAFATDLHAPDLRVDKTVENLTHPGEAARPGDRLRYSIAYRDVGEASAEGVIASDPLPPGVTLVPGSLRLVDGDGPVALTDAPGDDVGDYDPATRSVRVFLGEGASPERGGTLTPVAGTDPPATVAFDVEVDATAEPGQIVDSATATSVDAALARPLQAVSNPATIDVRPAGTAPAIADLATSERQTVDRTGETDETSDAVTITDRGPDDATDVHAQIDVAPGETVASVEAPDATCAPDARGVACEIAHLDAGASVQVDLIEETAAPEIASAPTEVTAVASQLDEDAADNSAITPSEPVAPALPTDDDATLRTTIEPSARTVATGDRVAETVTVHDLGPGASGPLTVQATSSLPLDALTATAPGLRCRVGTVVRCAGASLAPGATVRLRLGGRPRRAGKLVWTADASSDRFDVHPGRQSAHATIVVRGARPALAVSLAAAPTVLRPGQRASVEVSVRGLTAPVSVCVRVEPPLSFLDPLTGSHERCVRFADVPAGTTSRLTLHVGAPTPVAPGPAEIVAVARERGAPSARASTRLVVRPAFTSCGVLADDPTAWPDC